VVLLLSESEAAPAASCLASRLAGQAAAIHKGNFLTSVEQCCGSGIRCLFDPEIRNKFFPDPESRISDPGSQTHIFESLVTIYLVKSSIIL